MEVRFFPEGVIVSVRCRLFFGFLLKAKQLSTFSLFIFLTFFYNLLLKFLKKKLNRKIQIFGFFYSEKSHIPKQETPPFPNKEES